MFQIPERTAQRWRQRMENLPSTSVYSPDNESVAEDLNNQQMENAAATSANSPDNRSFTEYPYNQGEEFSSGGESNLGVIERFDSTSTVSCGTRKKYKSWKNHSTASVSNNYFLTD